MKPRSWVLFITFYAAIVAPSVARGSSISFNVSVDTSALIGQPAGPFSLDFQLNDGLGIGDGNNIATVTNFLFGSGAATGSPTLTGGASGSLGGGATLTDTSFFNDFSQTFAPGSTLQFDVDLTTNVDAGGTPDEFSFAILDSGGSELPTVGFFDVFTVIDITSGNPAISAFAGDPSRPPVAGGAGIGVPQPTITPLSPVQPVPEPSSVLMLGSGVAIFVFCRLQLRSTGQGGRS